jgi:hypothetical protein
LSITFPLRGQPAKLQGELIGRGDAGYTVGSDLELPDPTGMISLRYASRFGLIGNFLFGMKRVKSLREWMLALWVGSAGVWHLGWI